MIQPGHAKSGIQRLPIMMFLMFFMLVHAYPEQINFESKQGVSLGSSINGGVLESSNSLGIQPYSSNESGFLTDIDLGIRADFSDSGISVVPGVSQFLYRVMITGSKLGGDRAVGTGGSAVASSIAVGRVMNTDPLGYFSPINFDGINIVYTCRLISLEAGLGYTGFLFNDFNENARTEVMQVLAEGGSADETELPADDLLPGLDGVPPWLELDFAPSALTGRLQLLFPELIGRQSPFVLAVYRDLIRESPEQDRDHLSISAGMTGSLSRRMFYTFFGSFSSLSSSGGFENSAASLLEVRGYPDGKFAPRLGLTGFASFGDFVLPQGVGFIPEHINFIESRTWYSALDAEGLLYQSSRAYGNALGWRAGVYAAGKTAQGRGLINDSSFDSRTGFIAAGGNIGLRQRFTRDLALDLQMDWILIQGGEANIPLAQFTLEYRY
ncbi:hypothetical protein [Salinispira pacifica]|uniref:Uncharacterized protein n=1 Tax=Salinispira pacifica TaxID=1307761 RepID=V5WJU7_9SPIO|nr:hypothetical protein [Salinispira pacifica]AHC15864.1 hypothetical protein L21SP2_2512 [Salinispira pacifica]